MYLVSRRETFAKLFFSLSFFGLIMYIALAFYSFHTAYIDVLKTEKTKGSLQIFSLNSPRFEKNFKYILLWTIPGLNFNQTEGQQTFKDNNCSYQNCYITTNKNLLSNDVRNFNTIVFNISTLKNWDIHMPKERFLNQKYVFYSMLAADKFPVCNMKVDGYFNWTWSYKLSSDIVTPFIEVRGLSGELIAPKYWNDSIEDTVNYFEVSNETNNSKITNEIDVNVKNVGNKTKAMMWYWENCHTSIDKTRMFYIRRLKQVLKESNLTFDIYGCGFEKCPKEDCFKSLERDYYFYLVQEESCSYDYVTTDVLKGYHHNAVPVVIGGADYGKFLPSNSYIDGAHRSVERLAALIQYTIRNPTAYQRYFTWKNHFTIRKVNPQRGYCDLCSSLNDKEKVERKSVYDSLRAWWLNGSLKEGCHVNGAEGCKDVMAYVKAVKKPRHNKMSKNKEGF